MDVEVKQRNRRRRRAQRMQAQRESKAGHRDGDSGDDDENVVREKPQRPPIRRKKSKELLVEEDIVEGFSILQFRSYEDLELVLKISSKENIKRLSDIVERPKLEPKAHITHHISVHNNHGLSLTQDPATSDDSGRASERLTGSSVAPRDADSSRDRLSDASSRCSSGKGYICDSEGEDDKGSDASSVIFASTPASRKREFQGALVASLPLSNGTSKSPVPAPTPPNLPLPSPAPAQQPPLHPPAATTVSSSAGNKSQAAAICNSKNVPTPSPVLSLLPPAPVSVPVSSVASVPVTTMPQPAAAPIAAHHPPPALDSTTGAPNHAMRTDSPAVATSANVPVAPGAGQYLHPSSYPPLYAPYAVHTPYSNPSPAGPTITATVPSSAPTSVSSVLAPPTSTATTATRPPSPSPGHSPSPSRERESYSNVSSLSRGSVTPSSCPPPTTVSSSLAMSKAWSSGPSPHSSPAPQPRPTPPLHSFPSPMFAAPLPPVSRASPLASSVQPPNPNPFSAESLFQSSNHADMLRRELDNRFLASQDRSLGVAPPPPYLRTEMHQHQHHHTHVHQHTTSLLPPPATSSLFPTPLAVSPMDRLARRSGSSFKDIPKIGGHESPFYRQNLGMSNYPGYTPGLMHPGLTAGPTPFVPPNHLPTFQPKSMPPDPNKPKTMKSGKWNAMHVRVAWEIYHHQQKSGDSKGGGTKTDLLRPPSHLFSPSVHSTRPHDLSFPPSLTTHRPPGFDQPHPSSLFTPPPSHLGKSPFTGSSISPFTRYGGGFGGPPGPGSPFGVSPFASAREMSLGQLHDPWRGLQRTVPNFPPGVNQLPPPAPWSIKPDPILEQRDREAREREERERERLRREREERERERREREEKQRRLEQQQQQQQERERERREKERRDMERRELERERERERLLHQQRMAESAKQMAPPVMRDRSPLRNGQTDPNESVRVKEEPRVVVTKEEDLLRVADHRFHPFLRHPSLQPPPGLVDRARMLSHLQPHFGPPPTASHWPPPPHAADPFYRYEPLRYNPLVDVMRVEEERAKLFNAYAHSGQLRQKDPSLMHLRPGPGPPLQQQHMQPQQQQQQQQQQQHKMSATPPNNSLDLHKKEEPR